MVWGNTNAFKLNSIITLQKRAVRILSNADYLAHTSEIFLNHKILKLDQINIYKLQYSCLNNTKMKFLLALTQCL